MIYIFRLDRKQIINRYFIHLRNNQFKILIGWKIEQAFFDAPKKDKAAFEKLSGGKNEPFQTVTHEAYLPVVELNKFVDALRKK